MPLRRAATVPNTDVRYGPGSAAHHHSALKARVNALVAKSGALRCVRGTEKTKRAALRPPPFSTSSLQSMRAVRHGFCAVEPDIDADEKEQPHHVDEMPVPGGEFEAEMLGGCEVPGIGAEQADRQKDGADQHLGFEFAAWYWHFVDVVWLFLFICIYVWPHGAESLAHGAHSFRLDVLKGAAAEPPFLFWRNLKTRRCA